MRRTFRPLSIGVLAGLLLAACASRPPAAPPSGASPGAAGVPFGSAAPATRRAPVATVDTDTLAGAPYRIDIPADWNGELVVNAHGYVVVGTPSPARLEVPGGMQPLLDRGFAVAASAYSAQGWAIGEAVDDSERLRAHFVARHGRPTRSWLVGWSMGGLVALASAERHPRAWDGVVAMCGVAVSTEAMFARAALAPLAAFDALHPGVLPQGPGGLADPALPDDADGDAIEAAFATDETSAEAFARHFDIPRAELASSLWLYYVALRELVARADGFPVASAAGTDGDEAALGVRIRRYAAQPAAADYVRRTGALAGSAPVPVVLQPNAVDPVVPARFSRGYAESAAATGRGAQVRVMPGIGKGHCRFPPDAVVGALEQLRAPR